jgi:hypothetical protein
MGIAIQIQIKKQSKHNKQTVIAKWQMARKQLYRIKTAIIKNANSFSKHVSARLENVFSYNIERNT